MTRNDYVIDYDDDEIDPNRGQCCLKAAHFAGTFALLAILSAVLVVLSYYDDYLLNVRTPAAAILGLTSFLTVVTAFVSIFIECRLQEKTNFCRHVYFFVCCLCIDDIDKRLLEEKIKTKNERVNTGATTTCKYGGVQRTCDRDVIYTEPLRQEAIENHGTCVPTPV